MARPKRTKGSTPARPATRVPIAEGTVEARTRPASFDIGGLARPSFSSDLVPVFMLIETDLFRHLNDKAVARRTGYDMLLRTILRDHLGEYGDEAPQRGKRTQSARQKRG